MAKVVVKLHSAYLKRNKKTLCEILYSNCCYFYNKYKNSIIFLTKTMELIKKVIFFYLISMVFSENPNPIIFKDFHFEGNIPLLNLNPVSVSSTPPNP
jgi:hypothetical protein